MAAAATTATIAHSHLEQLESIHQYGYEMIWLFGWCFFFFGKIKNNEHIYSSISDDKFNFRFPITKFYWLNRENAKGKWNVVERVIIREKETAIDSSENV